MPTIPASQRPDGNDFGVCRVIAFPSGSRVGRKHYTIVSQTTGVQCSCEGWQNHGHCWHIEKLADAHLSYMEELEVGRDFQVKLPQRSSDPFGLDEHPVVDDEEGTGDGT
jgi:hypothetical protein